MAQVINTNVQSLKVQRNLNRSQSELNQANALSQNVLALLQ